MGHDTKTFSGTNKKEFKMDTFDKLFDKIEKQCAFSLKNMAEIVKTCDSIETTITKTKQAIKSRSLKNEN